MSKWRNALKNTISDKKSLHAMYIPILVVSGRRAEGAQIQTVIWWTALSLSTLHAASGVWRECDASVLWEEMSDFAAIAAYQPLPPHKKFASNPKFSKMTTLVVS